MTTLAELSYKNVHYPKDPFKGLNSYPGLESTTCHINLKCFFVHEFPSSASESHTSNKHWIKYLHCTPDVKSFYHLQLYLLKSLLNWNLLSWATRAKVVY